MHNITLDQASVILEAALAKGRQLDFRPLTIAVLDSGGHLVAFKREDNSGILRPEIAIGKAWGSLGMGVSSRTLRDNLADRPTFVNALQVASQGRIFPVPGGVLILDKNREMIGAVGISGDRSERDELCAIEGIKAAGLHCDPAEPDPLWRESRLGQK